MYSEASFGMNVLLNSTTQEKFAAIILSNGSQSAKVTQCFFPLISDVQNKQT